MPINQLKSALEAILFLQNKPISLARLSETIDETLPLEEYRSALSSLIEDYQHPHRGIELAEVADGYLFRTKIEHRDMIRRMYQIEPVRMSQAMLEVLSIIAFHQPVTREKLEEIRGVECGHHIRNLMEKKLVRMVGRSDAVGKPMLYSTTKEFLELFGLTSLKEMPSLQEIEDMLPKNEVGEHEDEENRIRSELQVIVANSKELEFSDIELEEQKLFGSQDGSKNEETKNSNSSSENEHPSTQNREAEKPKFQQDEVAGTISFGSISAAQEAEWESDTVVQPRIEEREPSEQGQSEPTETPEDYRERRYYEPQES